MMPKIEVAVTYQDDLGYDVCLIVPLHLVPAVKDLKLDEISRADKAAYRQSIAKACQLGMEVAATYLSDKLDEAPE